MPPLLEHLESLLGEGDPELDLQTFKLVDQLSGRTLGVRADTTPQVARIDAHLLNRDGVTRLCYCGPLLHTRPAGLHASREPLQFGAEIYGHAGLEADLEVHGAGARRAARRRRRRGRPLDLGDARIVRGVLGRRAARRRRARRAATRRWPPRTRARCATLSRGFPADAAQALRRCPASTAAATCWPRRGASCRRTRRRRRARRPATGSRGASRQSHPEVDLGFDLADLSGYALLQRRALRGLRRRLQRRGGARRPLRRGRRRLRPHRPAVGFSLDLKELAALAERRGMPPAIRAPWGEDAALRAAVRRCASTARPWCACCPGMSTRAQEFDCDRELVAERRRVGRARAVSAAHGLSSAFLRDHPSHASRASPADPLARPRHGPQRRRRRHPVGRRRQGQGRRLADRPRRRRGALPGRPQRRPHAGHQGREDGAAADPVGHHARRRGLLHRQRRGGRPDAPAGRDRAPGGDRRRGALAPVRQRVVPADPAVPRRGRQGARGAARDQRRGQDRHHRQGHRPGLRRQGGAPRAARAGPEAPRALREEAARAARAAQLRARAGYLQRRAARVPDRSSTRRWALAEQHQAA